MEWKDSDLDYDINCVFTDEARFNINMKNNWARSTIGTPAIVEVEKTRSPSHIIFGAIHPSSIIHFAMKKPLPTREKYKRLRQIRVKNRRRESLQETKIKG